MIKNKYDIDSIEAGEEVDNYLSEQFELEVMPFSSDLAAAIQIAEKLRENGWLVIMKWMPAEFYFMIGGGMHSEYDATPQPDPEYILKGKTIVDLEWMRKDDFYFLPVPKIISADTPALAICRAAVSAIVALQEEEEKRRGCDNSNSH